MSNSTAQIQSREETEALLRNFLENMGYNLLNEPRANGEQGPAVISEKGGIKYWVEVIGAKPKGPSCSIDFKVAFCQAISRLSGIENEKAVIAMPEVFFYNGMSMRALKFGKYAWNTIGNVFPLEIWFVSPQGLEQHKWNEYP